MCKQGNTEVKNSKREIGEFILTIKGTKQH